jgi:hypothetical protein
MYLYKLPMPAPGAHGVFPSAIRDDEDKARGACRIFRASQTFHTHQHFFVINLVPPEATHPPIVAGNQREAALDPEPASSTRPSPFPSGLTAHHAQTRETRLGFPFMSLIPNRC